MTCAPFTGAAAGRASAAGAGPDARGGDRDRPSPRWPGDDRAGLHPWLILAAAAAAATRSQPGGAPMARRDGPEQVRSTLGQPTRPAGPTGRRERRGRGCLPGRDRRGVGLRLIAAIARRRCVVRIHRQSPTSTPNHSRHHRIQSGNRPGRRRRTGNTRVCRSAIASPTGIGRLNPPHYAGNMAKGRNRRRRTANRGP